MADSEAPFSPSARDGPSRRAAHGLSGLGVRSEQYICGCVRCDAESRRTATARSGIIGLTILDSSRCHRMAVGIRRMRGRLSAAKPCAFSAAKCVRLRRRGCDAFVLFAHPAWACRVSPVAIRWLGSDLRRDKARGHRRRCQCCDEALGAASCGGLVRTLGQRVALEKFQGVCVVRVLPTLFVFRCVL